MKAKVQIGKKFARLLVVSVIPKPTPSKPTIVMCKCDCGEIKPVRFSHLTGGLIRSCGCLRIEKTKSRVTIHGESNCSNSLGTSEFRSWSKMWNRCTNPNSNRYHRYGGRGIRICKRWEKFKNFLSDMGRKPTAKHSIERKNNDGNYTPSNCKWATAKEQSNNRGSHNA